MAILRDNLSAQEGAKDLSEVMSGWLNRLVITNQFRTCVTCINLKDDRFCQKFNANPPASVIVVGCDQYEDNQEIPF